MILSCKELPLWRRAFGRVYKIFGFVMVCGDCGGLCKTVVMRDDDGSGWYGFFENYLSGVSGNLKLYTKCCICSRLDSGFCSVCDIRKGRMENVSI